VSMVKNPRRPAWQTFKVTIRVYMKIYTLCRSFNTMGDSRIHSIIALIMSLLRIDNSLETHTNDMSNNAQIHMVDC